MVKTINLGICIMEKADFKTNDTEIIVEGIDNLSSNLKVFIQSRNFKESTLNYVFERG